MTINYSNWPDIKDVNDLPLDGRYDRMFAEWLVAEGVIDREDFELQVRLTKSNRSARLKALEDWEAWRRREAKDAEEPTTKYNHKSGIFTKNGVSWMQRTVPFKRGRHRKEF